ncbi:MAG: hypothetical protein HGA78_07575 [Nitrospirales bacterium]|nr:hypothetical protein [Nitrospirales bacterium]
MCPKFSNNVCTLAGIEPENIHCICDECCRGNSWEWCRAYISQFFIFSETSS